MLIAARWTGYRFDRVAEKAVKLQGNAAISEFDFTLFPVQR